MKYEGGDENHKENIPLVCALCFTDRFVVNFQVNLQLCPFAVVPVLCPKFSCFSTSSVTGKASPPAFLHRTYFFPMGISA